MKTIFVYASLEKRNSYFYRYTYGAFPHPVGEWYNIFEADTLGMSIYNDNVDWEEYELAIVFAHSDSAGTAKWIRKKCQGNIKIVIIPEPPPDWYLTGKTWGWAQRMRDDAEASNIVAISQEIGSLVERFSGLFGTKNCHFVPLPINISEYSKFKNLGERKKILSITCHCNYLESSIRSWRAVGRVLDNPSIASSYRTRVFYAIPSQWEHISPRPHEMLGYDWSTPNHLKRLNQCKLLVDDNIGVGSGHMSLEMACLDIPSVGSNDYIMHLYPELNSPYFFGIERLGEDLKVIVDNIIKMLIDESYYKSMVEIGRENLYKYHSYESCKKRLLELLDKC